MFLVFKYIQERKVLNKKTYRGAESVKQWIKVNPRDNIKIDLSFVFVAVKLINKYFLNINSSNIGYKSKALTTSYLLK
ncbi:hypothetical protein GCM10011518_38930 [Flavobacterium limi]|uniref:Uncharacterized protein n=1 Tax=Flavobacterium limi TaxID=2045105 RepID=A0ABQ1US59_9FLAO|nr:hypothetical protein GCM10011518_38930 [Flavobacterium limi]